MKISKHNCVNKPFVKIPTKRATICVDGTKKLYSVPYEVFYSEKFQLCPRVLTMSFIKSRQRLNPYII